MNRFRAVIKYENPSYEEAIEITAENSMEAKKACEAVLSSDKERISNLGSLNVYCSRRVVSCVLLERDWREMVLNLKFLENNV